MVYKNAQLLLHSAFMLSMVKMLLKGEVGIVMDITLLIMENHGKNHGIVFMNFCGNPVCLYEPCCKFLFFVVGICSIDCADVCICYIWCSLTGW